MAKLMGLGTGDRKFVLCYKDLVNQASSNTGNLVFNFAIEQCVDISPPKFRWRTPPHKVNQWNEPILIPMANNIGPHTDLLSAGPQVQDITTPLVVMGIGGQFSTNEPVETAFSSIPQGTIDWLKGVAGKSDGANISVRGNFTRSLFERMGLGDKAVTLGCPSHFLNPDNRLGSMLKTKSRAITTQKLTDYGVAICAGNYGYANLDKLEHALIGMINLYGGRYFVQHPDGLLKLAMGRSAELCDNVSNSINSRYFPDLSREDLHRWFRQFATAHVSVPQWSLDISRYALSVGTRIHGAQMALQSGVPAVCLYVDSRTKELCETMRVPCIEAKSFQRAPDINSIIQLLQEWDWYEYDSVRLKLAQETNTFLHNNGLTPSKYFSNFLIQSQSGSAK